MSDSPVMLRSREAAKRLNISHSLLVQLRHRGEGPDVVRVGKVVAYRPCDLERWAAERVVSSKTQRVAA